MTARYARRYVRGVPRSGSFVLAAVACLCLGPGTALAGEPSAAPAGEPGAADRARAAELVEAGTAAAKARRWEACIRALAEALALDGAATTAGALGLCEEQAGKLADAYDHLHRAAVSAPASRKGEPWKSYEAALARVMERVAVIWVTVYPREARVLVDGRPLGRADGRSFAVEPGAHTIAARLDGYEDKVHPVSVRGGDVPHVHLRLTPKPPSSDAPSVPAGAPIAAPSLSRAPGPAAHEPARDRWYMPGPSAHGVLVSAGYAALATSLVSGATALALEVDRGSLRSRVTRTACGPDSPSPPDVCGPLAERIGQRDAAAGVALGALAVAGLLSGATMFAFLHERDAARPAITATATLNGGGVLLVGSW